MQGGDVKRTGVILAAFAALALPAGTLAAPSDLAPSNCSTVADPWNYTQSALAACGIPTYPVSSTTQLPDGGTRYNYDLGSSGTFSLPVPPASFDPSTAPESDLAMYGLPPRPAQTNLAGYADWVATYSGLHWSPAPPFIANPLGLPPHITSSGPWAGFDAFTPDKTNYFKSVDDTWTEPHVDETACGSNQDVAFWTGIGGILGTGDWFGQNGTEYYPKIQSGSHFAWVQIWNPSGQNVVNSALDVGNIAHGDSIASASLWNPGEPWLAGSVTDNTTHAAQGWVWTTSGITSGHDAEVVLEGSTSVMGDFGNWSPGIASLNGSEDFSDYPSSFSSDPYRVQEVDRAGRADTSLMNSDGSFTVTWDKCTS
jgi:hypothetical protein